MSKYALTNFIVTTTFSWKG
jgi:hypothetical protein